MKLKNSTKVHALPQRVATLLVLTHELSRTGAPLLLADIVQAIGRTHPLRVCTWSHTHGPLAPVFGELGPLKILQDEQRSFASRFASFVLRALGIHSSAIGRQGRRIRASLGQAPVVIYANTIATARMLKEVARPGDIVLAHIHELKYWIERIDEFDRNHMLARADSFIAASRATAHLLIDHYQVPSEKILVQSGYVIDQRPPAALSRLEKRTARARWDLDPDAFVVVGCGSIQWRKGTDIFVQVAAEFCQSLNSKNVIFVWMGGEIDSRLHTECAYDVAKLGAEQAIRFVGPVEDPSSLFAAADVHLLTSREEPFGLVMLEVAMFNVPTVCFRGSGGPEEFVDEQCGITVPYLSITGMVSAICDLVDDPLRVAALGRAANEKARRHHDPELSRRRVVGEFARVARPLLQHCDKLN